MDGEAVPLFKKRSAKAKAAVRKRPASPPPASHESDSDSDAASSQDEMGRQVKRQRKSAVVAATSAGHTAKQTSDLQTTKFEADRSTHIAVSNDATKQSNWYDENAPDALSEKNLLGKTRSIPDEGQAEDSGNYKGAKNYISFIRKNPDAPSKNVGPVKASTNVRTINFTDFSPDVCKDYKQTGFCGFGDGCIFLHAREDYAQGWQLDKAWEIQNKGKKNLKGTTVASANRTTQAQDDGMDEAELEKIPFACIICKESYKNPIVTKCGHYFCESCALRRYRKNPSCAACGAGTGGVFNVAKNLKKLLERKKEREEAKAAAEAEEADDE